MGVDNFEFENFFRLARKPFELLPNPEFLYPSKIHKKAMSYLEYGVVEKAGFILLTGEVGSGKTTLIRNLLKKIEKKVALSKVFNTRVNSQQLISMINDDFGLDIKGKDKPELLKDLFDFLIQMYAEGRHSVLIIDEAQNLDWELLEEVRMLSNLEADNSKLLQIILVGQPELRKVLSRPELRQFRQRISVSCHLYHLNKEEAGEYIYHRLEVAGNRNAVIFAPQALDIIYQYSRGVPRLINIICDFLMLTALAEKTREVNGDMARDVVKDLDFENQFWDFESTAPAAAAAPEGPKAQWQAHDKGDARLLNEVVSRLDSIEKTFSAQKTMPRDISSRLDALESAVSGLVEKEASRPVEAADGLEKPDAQVILIPEPLDSAPFGSEEADDESNNRKGGLLRRIFGHYKH